MKLLTNPAHGDRIDAVRTMYPSDLVVVRAPWRDEAESPRTVYGFVVKGHATLDLDGMRVALKAGDYFVCPDRVHVEPHHNETQVVVIRRFGYRALLQVGRIEEKGRLSYIDGCSDTLLAMPARLGDPCFNHLHFPPTIVQSQHTHPSIRLGIVIRGRGMAFGPGWEYPLEPGMVFLLEEQELHSFRTDKALRQRTKAEADALIAAWHATPDTVLTPEAEERIRTEYAVKETDVNGMDVIAFHPDSDWGPTDQLHPMLNRTYIGQTPKPGGAQGL